MNTVTKLIKDNAADVSEDYELLNVKEFITGGREGFSAYIVTGISMVEFIKQGYVVFVDTFAVPANRDIVASSINGKLNVKILEKQTNGLFLVSVNKKYKPRRIVESDNFRILGVVKGHLAVY